MDRGIDVISALWMVAAIGVALTAAFSKFNVFEATFADKISKNMGEITLALISTTSLGVCATIYKLVKAHKKESLLVSSALMTAKESSIVLNLLLSLPEELSDSVVRYGNLRKQLTGTLAASPQTVRRVLFKHHRELEARLEALSLGRLDLPLDESPIANYEIIETFGGRMDAVSRDHLKFWEEDLGVRYFEECTKARGKCGLADLSRIFILSYKSIVDDRGRILSILRKHLTANVGFAIVIEESLTHDFKADHFVREGSDDEGSTSLDFALFKNNMALTSFRDNGKKNYYGKSGERFKAVFRVGEGHSLNNKILQRQRDLWVDLIAEAWLVSLQFKSIMGTGVSVEERARIEKKAWADNVEINKRNKNNGFECDDPYFPLVVHQDADLEDKMSQLEKYYKPYSSLH